MARTVRSVALDTRAARLRLVQSRKHWQFIEMGLHVGYRRGPRGGTWYARRFAAGRYVEATIGIADDSTDADCVSVLAYRDALQAARIWWQKEKRRELGHTIEDGTITTNAACDQYLLFFEAKGGKSVYATRRVIDVHIRPSIGNLDICRLTTRKIREWHHALARAEPRVRTKRTAAAQATRTIDPLAPDAARARRATANRILTVLKAVLNHAWRERQIDSDDAWRPVKPFPGTDSPVVRYLNADECRRVANACQSALRDLVRAAILTGARYGELCRLKVHDVNLQCNTVVIREAKSGKPRHITLVDEAVALFSNLVAGRQGRNEQLLLRDDGTPWKAAQATRPLRDACRRANVFPEIGFHVLRHTHASALAMNGVPMGVIAAQLGHADTRVTERHYAHLAPSYVADTIRSNFPAVGFGCTASFVVIRPEEGQFAETALRQGG